MLEKPNQSDDELLRTLRDAYDLPLVGIGFLPLGADVNTAVYRTDADDGTVWFVKLRRGPIFEPSLAVPHLLASRGVTQVIGPYPTIDEALWTGFGEFTVSLYPWRHRLRSPAHQRATHATR
jgi:spectinomycin phosphotransferase